MATTRLIPMHRNKGKTAEECMEERVAYALDPKKTGDGKFVSAYQCAPEVTASMFMLQKSYYETVNMRSADSGVLLYQVRQAFAPGEVTPEDANKIGYEFAKRFLKGNHAFIVATHVDKEHIHNHIIWNAFSLDGRKKWRDFRRSGKAVAKLSDQICAENNLSVIDHPKWRGMSYNHWLGDKIKPTQRDVLRREIDSILAQNPKSFEDLLFALAAKGYEVKRRGQSISIKPPQANGYLRLSSLDEGGAYSEETLRAVIGGEREHKPVDKSIGKRERSMSLLIDIQQKLAEGKGKGYEQWAKVFNLKQMARTVSYLQERKLLSTTDLDKALADANARFDRLLAQIKAAEKRLTEIAALQKHIVNYAKTREVYIDYRASGYSRKFFAEHETEITLHKAAKQAFNELGTKKLPTMKSLREEYAAVLAEKKKAYADFVSAKDEKRALLVAKRNVETILEGGEMPSTSSAFSNEKSR